MCIAANMSAADAKPDLNTASQKQFRQVDHIGKTLAKRIQSNAPFSDWADVREKVSGIGEVRLDNLRKSFQINIAHQTDPPTDATAPSRDSNKTKIHAAVAAGQKVSIHCNAGFHRGPCIAATLNQRIDRIDNMNNCLRAFALDVTINTSRASISIEQNQPAKAAVDAPWTLIDDDVD